MMHIPDGEDLELPREERPYQHLPLGELINQYGRKFRNGGYEFSEVAEEWDELVKRLGPWRAGMAVENIVNKGED